MWEQEAALFFSLLQKCHNFCDRFIQHGQFLRHFLCARAFCVDTALTSGNHSISEFPFANGSLCTHVIMFSRTQPSYKLSACFRLAAGDMSAGLPLRSKAGTSSYWHSWINYGTIVLFIVVWNPLVCACMYSNPQHFEFHYDQSAMLRKDRGWTANNGPSVWGWWGPWNGSYFIFLLGLVCWAGCSHLNNSTGRVQGSRPPHKGSPQSKELQEKKKKEKGRGVTEIERNHGVFKNQRTTRATLTSSGYLPGWDCRGFESVTKKQQPKNVGINSFAKIEAGNKLGSNF